MLTPVLMCRELIIVKQLPQKRKDTFDIKNNPEKINLFLTFQNNFFFIININRKTATIIKAHKKNKKISDFLTEEYEKSLQVANKKHDIISIDIIDPREIELPNIGFLELEDAETGETVMVDTSNSEVRSGFFSQTQQDREVREKFFRSIGVDNINIFTDQSYVEPIVKFFRMRAACMKSITVCFATSLVSKASGFQ